MSEKHRLTRLDDGRLSFDCPGCGMMHAVNVDNPERPKWSWNGDMINPTFSPSILVRWTFGEKRKPKRCHSFVRNGNIQFLNDCTHEHAGTTLPLNPVDD